MLFSHVVLRIPRTFPSFVSMILFSFVAFNSLFTTLTKIIIKISAHQKMLIFWNEFIIMRLTRTPISTRLKSHLMCKKNKCTRYRGEMCKRGLRLSVIRNLIYLFDSLLNALGEMERDKKKTLANFVKWNANDTFINEISRYSSLTLFRPMPLWDHSNHNCAILIPVWFTEYK